MSRAHALPTAVSAAEPVDASPTTVDEALFARFVDDGCETSFAALYRRYEPRIRGFLLKRTGDAALADDLTQNVFARVLRAAHRFDAERSTFSRWSHAIVENVLKNHYRSSARSRLQSFSDVGGAERGGEAGARAAGLEHADPAADPERRAFAGEFEAALQRALLRLEPLYREPFILYQLEQQSFAEIAERLDIPVGTAKSRTHRARLQLRQLLREFGPE